MDRSTLAYAVALALSSTPWLSAQAKAPPFQGPLPIVGGVSAAAPSKETIVFELDAKGRLRSGGDKITFERMRAELSRFAKSRPMRKQPIRGAKISRAQLLLRMHPEVPFEAMHRVLQLCSQRDIFVYRIYFAVRARKDGPERAVAVFLPIDSGKDDPTWQVDAQIRYSLPAMDATVLRDRLKDAAKHRDRSGRVHAPRLILRPENNVTVASVLRVVYAAQRAGVAGVGFHGGGFAYKEWQKKPDFEALVKKSGARPAGEPGLRISRAKRAMVEEAEEIEEEVEVVDPRPKRRVRARPRARVRPRPAMRPSKPAFLPDYGARKAPPASPDQVDSRFAADRALKWLVAHQDEDGKWDSDGFMKHDKAGNACDGAGNPVHDVGVTGLALLALLGSGSTMKKGPYKDTIKKGVKWLFQQQNKNGLFGTNASHDFIYGHAIATCAMIEAYGLSDYKVIKRTAQNGLNYLESHRNPYACWRYQPRDNDNDASVSSWCLLAYKLGQDFGLAVNRQALLMGTHYLDMLTTPATGRCGYTKRGSPSSRSPGDHARRFPLDRCETLTAAGLFVRAMLGQQPAKVPVMGRAAETIRARPPKWDAKAGSIDFYYWYYASHAMYQMGPEHWKRWSKVMLPVLLKNQRRDGNFKGSWDPVSVWSESGGRVYATAILALTLQAPIRYARPKKSK